METSTHKKRRSKR